MVSKDGCERGTKVEKQKTIYKQGSLTRLREKSYLFHDNLELELE